MQWQLPIMCAALALASTVTSTPITPDASASPRQLKPIHIRDYQSAFSVRRRNEEDFSRLDLQQQSELIYGSPLENEELLLANMTLYAPDGLQMILMEEFDGLTTAVDCKGDDGMMSLTFKSLEAFNYALKTWNYINKQPNAQFLLIANAAGCGPDDQRQPYKITNIREDSAALTTYLTARTAPWSEVAGTYDMDFGKAIPFTKPNKQKRGLWDDIKGAVQKVGDGIKSVATTVGNDVKNVATTVGNDVKTVADDVGNVASSVGNDVKKVADGIGDVLTGTVDVSKGVTFGMNAGTENQRTEIVPNNTFLTLACINCFIAGSVKVTGHLSVDHFSLKDLSIDGVPQDLKGALELEAMITKTERPNSLLFTKELFSAPVPDAGIEIPGIFKLGAILSYDIGVQATFLGSATIDFGLALSVPDSAGFHADIMNPSASSAQGLEGDITPIFDIKALSATVQLAAFASPKLSFGVSLTKIGTVDIALTFKMPQIAVKFAAAYNQSGLCSQTPGSSQTGVEITSQVGLELDLQIDASLGDASTKKPSFVMKLWSDYHPLSSACFPLAIPGLTTNPSYSLPPLPVGTGNDSFPVANLSLLTGTAYSTYSVPTIAVSVPSAVPLSGNGSNIVIPTGFLRSSVSGAVTSTGTFATSFPLSTGNTIEVASPTGRYPSLNSSSPILPSASASNPNKRPKHRYSPSGSRDYPPNPTGRAPAPPTGYPSKPTGLPSSPPSGFSAGSTASGAAASGDYNPGASSQTHNSKFHGPYTMPGRATTLVPLSSKGSTTQNHVAAPFPTDGAGSRGSSGAKPTASGYRRSR